MLDSYASQSSGQGFADDSDDVARTDDGLPATGKSPFSHANDFKDGHPESEGRKLRSVRVSAGGVNFGNAEVVHPV